MTITAEKAFLLEAPLEVAEGHYLLSFKMPGINPVPGQFVNIRISDSSDPLLRRPFSIFSYEKDVLRVILRVVGKGTRLLAGAHPGSVDILGPSGRGFSLEKEKRVLCAGGGVGNAPLFWLSKALRHGGCDVTYVYGARSGPLVYCLDEYARVSDRLVLCTDDGSAGERATVIDILSGLLAEGRYDRIYTCGPTGMMCAVTEMAGTVPVEVSVENYFGCGIGLCSGCTVPTVGGNRRACIDGPVFDGRSIIW